MVTFAPMLLEANWPAAGGRNAIRRDTCSPRRIDPLNSRDDGAARERSHMSGPRAAEPDRPAHHRVALRQVRHDDGRDPILEPRVMQVLLALLHADGAILSRDGLDE